MQGTNTIRKPNKISSIAATPDPECDRNLPLAALRSGPYADNATASLHDSGLPKPRAAGSRGILRNARNAVECRICFDRAAASDCVDCVSFRIPDRIVIAARF